LIVLAFLQAKQLYSKNLAIRRGGAKFWEPFDRLD
jgi:hypothetical protein